MLVDYAAIDSPSWAHSLFYFATGLGHQAVVVFFILSGFFVGGAVLKAGAAFDPIGYAVNRLSRLWMVLVPALVLTFFLDALLSAYRPEVLAGAYHQLWNSGPTGSASYSASASTFLGNIIFLQTIVTPVFGSNDPLWSLANEFWYYVIFPLGALALGPRERNTRIPVRLLYLVAAIAILSWLPRPIRDGFVVWLAGVAIFLASKRISSKRRPFLLVAAIALLFASLAYSKAIELQSLIGVPMDIGVCIGFSGLCLVLATWPSPAENALGALIRKSSTGLSEISYSLYLCHFPMVIVIAAFGFQVSRTAPAAASILGYFGWLGALVAFAAIFWFTFERHTGALRAFAYRVLGRPSPHRT